MGGNKLGGEKAAATIISRYGPNFYRRIGAKGGHGGRTGGFYARRDLARKAGKIGGHNSSRAGILNGQGKKSNKNGYDKDGIPITATRDEYLNNFKATNV
jgi:hypothetical protein